MDKSSVVVARSLLFGKRSVGTFAKWGPQEHDNLAIVFDVLDEWILQRVSDSSVMISHSVPVWDGTSCRVPVTVETLDGLDEMLINVFLEVK